MKPLEALSRFHNQNPAAPAPSNPNIVAYTGDRKFRHDLLAAPGGAVIVLGRRRTGSRANEYYCDSNKNDPSHLFLCS
jgi:hypothetical protein